MTKTSIFALISVFALTACQSTTQEPRKEPTPEQQAEIEEARAEMIAAECALWAETSADLPEKCL